MSDLTIAFEELPLLSLGSLTAAGVDGAVDIDLGTHRTNWKIKAIRLNGWDAKTRKTGFVTLTEEHPAFLQIASAIVIHPVYGEMIEQAARLRHCPSTAYDQARGRREAA